MIKLRAIADCTIQLEKVRLEAGSEILFGLLAHLIVERGKPVPRARLVDAFWWNADDAEGRHCLRQNLYKLRTMGVPIDADGDAVTLGERAALADFDCADERTLALSPLPPEDAVAIFPGYAPRASAPFLTWLERTREKAGRAVRGVLVRALGEARRRNGWEEAAKLARQCLVLDPLNEEATLTLAEYTALQGDKREALRMIDAYMEEIGGTYGDLRIPASLLRNRISERVAYPPASAAGKIALVGRDDSLHVLAGVAAEVSGGAGQTCVIHGPPGIGKTRLITEFANISAMKGARIVRVDCHADAAERALSVFMELAPQLLRMPGALGCSPEALRLVRRLGRHDPNERLDPEEYGGAAYLHAAVRASLRDLIDAIAAERPLYLLIEDVHWIDPVSLEVLKEIIGSNRQRALLVLMTTRTLGDGTLLAGVDRRQLIVHELAPLADGAARRLAETLCGALAIETDAKLVEWCMQRGAGNPLFMTELLAHWRETKDTSRIPVSLEALIDERVGALSDGALRTLQVIALLEGEATYELLEAVLGMQRWQVIGYVEELDKAGLILGGADRIRPRHELLAGRAISRSLPAARAAMHERIARALEARLGEFTESAAIWKIADHFAQAGAVDKALHLSIRGADHLAALGAFVEASKVLKEALRLASDVQSKLVLFEKRRSLLMLALAYDELVLNSQEALKLEREHTGRARIHNAHELALFSILHQSGSGHGDNAGILPDILLCVEAGEASLDHRIEACFFGLATAAGDGLREWGRKFFGALGSGVEWRTEHRYHLAKCSLLFHTMFGSLDEAMRTARSIESYIPTLDLSTQSSAYRMCGYPFMVAGELLEARCRFQSAYEVAERTNSPSQAGNALLNWASSYVHAEDYGLAWEYYQRALQFFARNIGTGPGAVVITGAELAYLRGDDALGDALVESLPEMRPLRHRFEREVLLLLRSVRRREPLPPERLAKAKTLYEHLADQGWIEFPAGALAAAIASQDGRAGREFAAGYLGVRRERGRIWNPFLRDALAG